MRVEHNPKLVLSPLITGGIQRSNCRWLLGNPAVVGNFHLLARRADIVTHISDAPCTVYLTRGDTKSLTMADILRQLGGNSDDLQ